MGLSTPIRKSIRAVCACTDRRALQLARPKSVAETKLMIVMQYWDGDKPQAEKFLRLITDMQDGYSTEAGVMFSARFDSSIDEKLVEYVSRKFPVVTYVGRRRGTGWPFGCNEVWFDTMLWLFGERRVGRLKEYKAALTMEADDAPLAKDWIKRLSNAFDAARPAHVVGRLYSWDRRNEKTKSESFHCNGNAMFALSPELERVLVSTQGVPAGSPWDCFMARAFEKVGWASTMSIWSMYKQKAMTAEVFDWMHRRGGAFVHGFKDSSAIDLARRRFVGTQVDNLLGGPHTTDVEN